MLGTLSGRLGKLGFYHARTLSTLEFKNLPLDNFYDVQADIYLMNFLKNMSIKTLLDADAHFVKGYLLMKGANDLTEIDCIYDGNILPMKRNIFRRVYKDFSECHLRHYDAVLLSEKSPAEFDTAFYLLKNTADLVITFAKDGSKLIKHIQDNKGNFKKVEMRPSFSGQWIFCYRHTPPTDFAMYVVTHKLLTPEHVQTFPDNYKIIQGGHAINEDLGYLGDDTGDNISELNFYINELTALYWMWKNTSHTLIGLCHYRRFLFKEKRENFLTEEEALQILEDYDIIVQKLRLTAVPMAETVKRDVRDENLVIFGANVLRQHLMRTHPDYLDAFDYKMNLPVGYFNTIFMTRRNVFNAYCEWLFSFVIDATQEAVREKQLSTLVFRKKRLMSFLAERMFNVWLMKNNLRVKEINMIQIPGL